ncbi:MAG: hypothetical protein PHP95_08645 [Desulfuromonadaceae bacterium]|nr:hypothetical protein [Desulfuromonadaceae bacterium]MDD2848509.1 hypothetical protein [Desulfuromonadaceae bacterium]MDD4129862.1 hypothetical protein [Desulfuromonadaceae bacterium]
MEQHKETDATESVNMSETIKRKIYGGVRKIFSVYWSAYGGWKALFSSFYLHISFVLLIVLYPLWSKDGWWDTVITIMPNMIGFSLAGLSIWLATGDEKLKSTISGTHPASSGKHSPYIKTNASFVHFILVQVSALLAAIIAKAYYIVPFSIFAKYDYPCLILIGWGAGFLLFLYAIATAVAVTMSIFRVSTWYDAHQAKLRAKSVVTKDKDS